MTLLVSQLLADIRAEALQNLLLIPRTPCPTPPPPAIALEEKPVEDLTTEELLELAMRQRVTKLPFTKPTVFSILLMIE